MNLMMLLEMAASGFPERVAFKNEDDTLTYGQLFNAAGTAAEAAKRSGAGRIAFLDVSSLAVPVALFASAWSGLPFVPLNYRLTGGELDDLLDEISPCYLITDEQRAAGLSRPRDTVVVRDEFLAAARGGSQPDPAWSMDGDDIAILLFTSGTTGKPKAAVLRQKHLVSYIFGSVEFGGAAEEDAALVSVPPYHIAGMAAIISSVYSGRRVVQMANFSAEGWTELAGDEKITNAFVVPTMLARIVEALEAGQTADLSSLRSLSYGGGKMPQTVIEKAMGMFATTDFTNAYGLTETSSTITLLGPDDHREAVSSDDPAIRRRIVSVGRPLPGVEIAIRDEDGKALGPGQAGEIYVRGEQVSGEYLGRGSNLDSDGWFPTRDGGHLDEGGYLFIEGRIDDVIVRGGENLSPGEIEDVLLEHEAVADCAVVGVPDEQWGEAVAAVIVTRQGCSISPDEVREWVKGQLRSSRAPTRVEFCDELPYNEIGKLLRRKVKAGLIEGAEGSP
jgi:acyl-CoA synthetase (AMP-forming)/AMP-acid ligase II